MKYQVRLKNGELRFFPSLKEAHQFATQIDKSAWKISWEEDEFTYRFYKTQKSGTYRNSVEQKLNQLSTTYRNFNPQNSNLNFWVHQKLMDIDLITNFRDQYPDEESWENFYTPQLIIEVLSDSEFLKKYNL